MYYVVHIQISPPFRFWNSKWFWKGIYYFENRKITLKRILNIYHVKTMANSKWMPWSTVQSQREFKLWIFSIVLGIKTISKSCEVLNSVCCWCFLIIYILFCEDKNMESPKSWDGNGVESFLLGSLWTLKFYGFNNLTDINYLLNM